MRTVYIFVSLTLYYVTASPSLSPMCLSVGLTEVLDPHLADEEIRGGLRLEGGTMLRRRQKQL